MKGCSRKQVLPYISLHNHTSYSLLDGLTTVEQLVKRTKIYGFPAVAITDHGSLGGIIKLYKLCKTLDIIPLIGCEIYLTDDKDNLSKEEMTKDNYHLTVIAKNQQGLQTLLTLNAEAYKQNFYYKPRINEDKLLNNSKGLIVLTGCLGGKFAATETPDKALNLIKKYKESFGKNIFMEVMFPANDDSSQKQKQLNGNAFLVGKALDILPVLTTDSHFSCSEEKDLHTVLMCIGTKKTLEEFQKDKALQIPATCYLKSLEEVKSNAQEIGSEEIVTNSLKILDLYEGYNLELNKYKPIPFSIETQPDFEEFKQWKESRQFHEQTQKRRRLG